MDYASKFSNMLSTFSLRVSSVQVVFLLHKHSVTDTSGDKNSDVNAGQLQIRITN